MSEPRTSPPSSAVALLLGLVCTGLGQMYCGCLRRGLLFLLASLLLGPVLVAAVLAPPSRTALFLLLGAVAAAALVLVVSVVDAGLLARRLRQRAATGPAIGLRLGLLFAVVGLAAPVATALVLRATTLEAFRIAAGSMEPTLHHGERCLVDKLAPRYGLPARGQVIVYRASVPGSPAFVKRVVGLPGDTVEVRGAQVLLNGAPLTDDSAAASPSGTLRESNDGRDYWIRPGGAPAGPITVPIGHVYVLGDDRAASSDSRAHGTVAHAQIVGVVRYVVWPLDRLGTVFR